MATQLVGRPAGAWRCVGRMLRWCSESKLARVWEGCVVWLWGCRHGGLPCWQLDVGARC